ncbi:hypothetical protein [Actinoplanes derwentensis]|uniref:Uncharacterized protein n=1 Tax=Actinoplanes derwentensis TaxID=113562 RepID=A0A1H2C9F0_9ACTN|nr:hypothetical protein [Actinoplanes derwentensis]SDT66882.1 hypothetical protein SAMN04489716_5400 [Actinoplanes derwentensis]
MLPPGWVHNPHTLGQAGDSVHLTSVVRERTRYWIGEQSLTAPE